MNTNTNKVVPAISETLTVPELIKFASLEVENILMKRETEWKMEMEKLREDNDRLKEQYDLMEKKHGLAELNRMKCESELKVAKSTQMIKDAEKKNCTICSRKLKSSYDEKNMAEEKEEEKRKIISEFSEKIDILEEKLGKMIEELNHEKKMVEEKNQMLLNLEKDKSIISSEFSVIIMELEKEMLQMEEKMAGLNKELNDGKKIRNVSEFSEKIKVLEGEKMEMSEKLVKLFEELNGEKKTVEEKNQMLLMVNKEKEKLSLEFSEIIQGLQRENQEMEEKFNDEKKLFEDKLMEVEMEKNRIVSELSEKIKALEGELLEKYKFISGFSEKMLNMGDFEENKEANVAKEQNRDSYPIITASKVVDLTVSDDELMKVTSCISNNEAIEMVKNEKIIERDFLKNCPKRKRSSNVRQEEHDGNIKILTYINPCETSKKYNENIWINGSDLLSACKKDPQLCMNAVCALYRKHFSAHESMNKQGFSVLDLTRYTSLAKYLMNNDKENRLSRSVSEVKEKDPEMLKCCERLVNHYYNELFEIYQNKLDPFFPN